MSDGRKRFAENQGSRDGRDVEEEFITTPQIATAEQMAQRRVVTVRRPAAAVAPGASATAAPSADAPTPTPAAPAAEAKPATSSSPFGSVLGSFSSIRPAAEGAAKGFSFGGFGGTPTAPPATAQPAEQASAPKPAFSFSFGAPAPTAAAPAAPATAPMSFSFGAPASTASAAPAATAAKPAFSFGGGNFNFGAAVSNFAAAREQQRQEQSKPVDDNNTDDADEDPEKEEAIGGGAASKLAAVELVTGEEDERTEIEVTAKLQQFQASDKQWHDRGAGPLKLNLRSNDKGEHSSVRFVMRDAKMKKALLNVNVQPVAFRFGQRGEKFFAFSAMEETTVATYLVRVQGTNAVEETKSILSICDNFLKEKK